MDARYITIKDFDMNQGDGINVSLWLSGCEHKCPGCYSPHTWDFNQGELFTPKTIDFIINLLKKDNIHKNLSILGGEPLCPENVEGVINLCKQIREVYPEKSRRRNCS